MPIEVLMPALSPTMEEGTLSSWNVKEGDEVKSGDVIAEIETDKATMEVEAVDEGRVGKLLVKEGTEGVKVNQVIALLLEEGEDESALKDWTPGDDKPEAKAPDGDGAKKSGKAEKAEKETSAKQVSGNEEQARPQSGYGRGKPADRPGVREGASDTKAPPAPKKDGERVKASPLARRLAAEADIDLTELEGSGPHGRIVKADVEKAREEGVGKPAKEEKKAAEKPAEKREEISEDEPLKAYGIAAERYEIVKADGIQKVSAKRLTESFRDVPHFPLTVDIEIDALLAFRKKINERAPEGVKVSVNDILIKASGVALKQQPDANASWINDGRVAKHKHADVSVAVAIEGGLITPVIKDADRKGLVEISKEMKDLAERARNRKLKPEEYQGGTFSLSNLGMFGIKSFASILNPPQGMILSVGTGEERPVVKDGALAKATVMTVTLTCDHRVVDGATGAKWLQLFKSLIEDPVTMLM
ncbi:pyruvate dehydrogenase complex dihydrolipoamide acetyltransferase [Marinicauda algicola]|uniref:Acetyltransferase component of pyruvate dehydrogenase complex n=1 Tax=Marinicauda algicola TaxID=2029849 RepID=A0A4S2GXV8_9PROT|nr:pyruvate dehydrogenase complex dihydrolipoamide acetyltransferase [Marinicauda algicola]TGY87893.1 pyruvate dehydrogenase complex dihydrolipoamide acetyltransferase [Marinicauda algicola]